MSGETSSLEKVILPPRTGMLSFEKAVFHQTFPFSERNKRKICSIVIYRLEQEMLRYIYSVNI